MAIVSPARKIAYEVLRRVEAEGAYASDLLHAELGAGVRPEDAGLATELVLGVLRWRRLLDFLLERQLKKRVERLDLPVALALRMGLYQLRFLERVPARAAVNESVELVKRARKTSAATLVNAVLRRCADEARVPAANFVAASMPAGERLGILHSHPAWMVERWLVRLGEERTVALLEANNRAPRLSGASHDVARREETFERLRRAGLRIEPGVILQSAFAVSGGSAARTEAFRSGAISIQDEASQVVPLLLDVQAGNRVLDLCAAPGGKTPPLVRAAGAGGLVVAADRHAHRLRAMREQFKRLGLGRVRLVELDAAAALPFGVLFQRILVDAPCSGTGTLARHPEIRWRLKAEQLAEFHALQTALLKSGLERLAPGGRLVYSTCSMESEENELVVEEVLGGARGLRLLAGREAGAGLAGRLVQGCERESLFDGEGYFRTSPAARPTDGFFGAVIERVRD
ncbi:MAG: 16S rRNA (cytosine(967)-C(5))-methyltransferase RsmB [Candidatus Acidiferrales bacterium]